MNEETIKKLEATAASIASRIEILRSLDCELGESWISADGCIFMPDSSYADIVENIHRLRRHKIDLTMTSYYCNASSLAIRYYSQRLRADVIFYATDAETALAAISGGKCKIEVRERSPEAEVVCSL